MNKFHLCLLLITLAFQSQAQTSSAEEKVLLDIERQRSEAIATGGNAFLNSVYHDQFRGVTAAGIVVDKKSLLEIFKSNNPDAVFSTDEMKATVYGYAAVVTGKLISKSKEGSLLGQLRFMHIYIKRNGQWKIIEGQGTAIKE